VCEKAYGGLKKEASLAGIAMQFSESWLETLSQATLAKVTTPILQIAANSLKEQINNTVERLLSPHQKGDHPVTEIFVSRKSGEKS
jgi:hypothetical protein